MSVRLHPLITVCRNASTNEDPTGVHVLLDTHLQLTAPRALVSRPFSFPHFTLTAKTYFCKYFLNISFNIVILLT